ncbi:MAG: hypothetical protein LBM08_15600 [Dysgonamonadaceae bacterium]|nr:hypothetical protein [Dysgonamonadaceae bacterium]
MKTLKFLIALLTLSMGMSCSENDTPGQQPDDSQGQDLLKSKLLGEWVVANQKNSCIYSFADDDTLYIKTEEGNTIVQWPYQTIAEDSIRIMQTWTTHNKVVFYSNDSIRISDFLPGIAAVYPPMFADAVLKRWLNDEKPETSPAISGIWEVNTISISGELTNIGSPPENASYSNISIEIPDATQAGIGGHTFYNTIWIELEIAEHQQINIKSYGGSRIAEDEWGMAFRDHIMFNVVKFDISNNELKFMDSQNNPVIVFTKKN